MQTQSQTDKLIIRSNEEWRDIPGYEGWYQVSNLGRVKRLKKHHCNHGKTNIVEREYILKLQKDAKGYFFVGLRNEYGKKNLKVHRLVAITFLPNTENKPQVDHIDRNRTNNKVSNLRWVTNKENQTNTDANLFLSCFGKTMILQQWAEETGVKATTIKTRLNRGWSIEEALTKPVDTRFYRKEKRV